MKYKGKDMEFKTVYADTEEGLQQELERRFSDRNILNTISFVPDYGQKRYAMGVYLEAQSVRQTLVEG
jgi:hypothetical protein